jgi:hypothetical protein
MMKMKMMMIKIIIIIILITKIITFFIYLRAYSEARKSIIE